METRIEIRCRQYGCNRLLMNYYLSGKNLDLDLNGFELKCEKCRRVFRLKHYTEDMLVRNAKNGVYWV